MSSESHTFIWSPFSSARKQWHPESYKHINVNIHSYSPSKRGWTHPCPSKTSPWFMLPSNLGVVWDSVRCELMIKQQGKAVWTLAPNSSWPMQMWLGFSSPAQSPLLTQGESQIGQGLHVVASIPFSRVGTDALRSPQAVFIASSFSFPARHIFPWTISRSPPEQYSPATSPHVKCLFKH